MESTNRPTCSKDKRYPKLSRCIRTTRYVRSIIILSLTFYLLLIPAAQIIRYLQDPGLVSGGVCQFLYGWHRSLSTKYETWARQRLASDKAAHLSIDNISGTEWPLFGSVFYLWATESLQDAWEEDRSLSPEAPAEYAKEAIEAAAALVADPAHASWVKEHWGQTYLEKENLFYRMLLIHSMISYQKLLKDDRYESLLRQQVDSLAQELDASPFGLLDDYPGQCYPVDIMPAYAAIQKADRLLGMDHSAVIERGIRAFQDTRLDQEIGLPAYNVDSETGYRQGPARGVGMSFMLIWCPELWPETARQWYAIYEKYFWQENRLTAGFREFSNTSTRNDWIVEVDAGPVIGGYGAAASAFGIGAARANGRMDHAYPLSALALTGAWRLPDGTLPVPRLLSDAIDAPYLGESAVLFCLTRTPAEPAAITSIETPVLVHLVITAAIIGGLLSILSSITDMKRTWTGIEPYVIPFAGVQFCFRIVLTLLAVLALVIYGGSIGCLLLIGTLVFPYIQKKKPKSQSLNTLNASEGSVLHADGSVK